jgi:hypothetical protein
MPDVLSELWHNDAPTLLAATLLAASGLRAHAQTYPTAKLTIDGSEAFPNGSPDTGSLTVAINGTNGYTETVPYGKYDTPASIPSGLAAQFCRDYIQFDLYAKAGANVTDPTVITLQFTGGQTFNSINYSGPSTSFGFNPTGFPSINPPASGAPSIQLSLITGPASMGVIITGTNIGVSKANNSISFGGVYAIETLQSMGKNSIAATQQSLARIAADTNRPPSVRAAAAKALSTVP